MKLQVDSIRQFAWQSLKILGRALGRLWGRDVMLYTGGVSFFALLAVFPAIALMIGLYSVLATPSQAELQADLLSHFMPAVAQGLFEEELKRLIAAPRPAISLQSGFALIIGAYASHRGFKALLAGLSFIHDEDKPRGFLSFNLMALVVLIAAFVGSGAITAIFLGYRMMSATLQLRPLAGVNFLFSEWTWTLVGLTIGLALIYRFAMSNAKEPVAWSGSLIGGAASALLFVGASWASAFYVEQIVHLGATYGTIASVVVLLIWLSWNVNAIFFGGALATEVDLVVNPGRQARHAEAASESKPQPISSQ
jgi:membrane protein